LGLDEIATRMGIEASVLANLESGKVLDPSLATLSKWAEALGQLLEIDLTSS
jgi:transcriptional regulator with XRE-family HTH domain